MNHYYVPNVIAQPLVKFEWKNKIHASKVKQKKQMNQRLSHFLYIQNDWKVHFRFKKNLRLNLLKMCGRNVSQINIINLFCRFKKYFVMLFTKTWLSQVPFIVQIIRKLHCNLILTFTQIFVIKCDKI
jgi:hypothetical protein